MLGSGKSTEKDTSALPKGAFLAEHGMFVIDAIHYADKNAGTYEKETVEFKELYDFGKYQSGIKAFPVTAAFDSKENAPSVTYELFSEEEKRVHLKTLYFSCKSTDLWRKTFYGSFCKWRGG